MRHGSALVRLFAHFEKIKKVGAFQCIAGRIKLWCRQLRLEVGNGLALTLNPASWIKHNRIPARFNPFLIVRHHQLRPLQ